jgi:hypothetical protein
MMIGLPERIKIVVYLIKGEFEMNKFCLYIATITVFILCGASAWGG